MTPVILFVMIVLTTSMKVTAAELALRHNDDASFQALITLAQQQAATLQRQEASMEAMQDSISAMRNRISVLERSLNATQQAAALQNHSLNSNISLLQDTVFGQPATLKADSANVGEQVAFSACYNYGAHNVDVGSKGILKYDYVYTNVGNGYSSDTGLFTAPRAGLYAFFSSVGSDDHSDFITAGIHKGSFIVGYLVAERAWTVRGQVTAFVTTHLKEGESVCVRHIDGSTTFDGEPVTTFSGFLVAAD